MPQKHPKVTFRRLYVSDGFEPPEADPAEGFEVEDLSPQLTPSEALSALRDALRAIGAEPDRESC